MIGLNPISQTECNTFQLITLRKDNAAQETLVTQYYAQIVGLSEGQQHKAF